MKGVWSQRLVDRQSLLSITVSMSHRSATIGSIGRILVLLVSRLSIVTDRSIQSHARVLGSWEVARSCTLSVLLLLMVRATREDWIIHLRLVLLLGESGGSRKVSITTTSSRGRSIATISLVSIDRVALTLIRSLVFRPSWSSILLLSRSLLVALLRAIRAIRTIRTTRVQNIRLSIVIISTRSWALRSRFIISLLLLLTRRYSPSTILLVISSWIRSLILVTLLVRDSILILRFVGSTLATLLSSVIKLLFDIIGNRRSRIFSILRLLSWCRSSSWLRFIFLHRLICLWSWLATRTTRWLVSYRVLIRFSRSLGLLSLRFWSSYRWAIVIASLPISWSRHIGRRICRSQSL